MACLLGGVGLTGLAFIAFRSAKWPTRFGPWVRTLLALVPGALGSGVISWLIHLSHDTNELAALLWWLVPSVALLGWILGNYEEVRSGAQVTGWVMYVVALVIFFYFLRVGPNFVVPSAFWIAELLLGAIRLSWALLIIFAFAALLFGSYAWRFSWPKAKGIGEQREEASHRAERTAQKSRARAAVRTSRLALALPAVMFLLITLLIWNGFAGLASKWPRRLFSRQSILRLRNNPTGFSLRSLLSKMDFSATPSCELVKRRPIVPRDWLLRRWSVLLLVGLVGMAFTIREFAPDDKRLRSASPGNARTHSNRQIRKLKESIKAFGFLNPILISSEGSIIAGHGRVEAAKLLKMNEVPTICLEDLTQDQIRAYMIADNRLAEERDGIGIS